MKGARYGLLLLVILLVGLFLRVYALSSESIWLDEGISIKLANARPLLVIVERALNNHPPFYFVLLHYWAKVFGNSVFSVRLMSVVFGLLSIYMIYILGQLLFNRETGLIAALLTAVSLFHIYYSQEARMYSMVAFLALVSMYFFIRLFQKGSLRIRSGYIISTFFLLYTHYSAWLVILTQNIYFFIRLFLDRRKGPCALNWERWIRLEDILFICYLPWFQVAFARLSKIQGAHDWIPKPTFYSLIGSFMEYSGSIMILPIFLGIFLYSLLLMKKQNLFNIWSSGVNKVYLTLLWLCIPILAPFFGSQFSASIYVTKYMIAASLAFYLLVAFGIANVKNSYVKFLIIGLIVFVSLASARKYYVEANKLPWREAAREVDRQAKTDDVIIFNDDVCAGAAFSHYFKRKDVTEKLLRAKGSGAHITNINKEGNLEALWQLSQNYDRVWVVLAHILDFKLKMKDKFFPTYRLLFHKIYSSKYYIGHNVDNFIEVFLFEKVKDDSKE